MEIKELTREELMAKAIKSNEALKYRIDNSINPPVLFNNIQYLYDKIVRPLELHFGVGMTWNSWYRCSALNQKVGGGPSSFHVFGAAVDLDLDGLKATNPNTTITNEAIYNYIKDHLPYTELINEYDFAWVHVALVKGRDQEKALKKIYNKSGKKVIERL